MEVLGAQESRCFASRNTLESCSNSISPSSVSNRSSTSSLNNGTPTASNGHLSSCKKSKKVTICDKPVSNVLRRDKSNLTSISSSGNRTSLIQVQGERQARKVRFFINGDKFFKGVIIPVSPDKFRTFDKLLEHLSRILRNQVTLPNGVRYIFNLEGKVLDTLSDLSHGGNYLAASFSSFKKIDYLRVGRENGYWNKMKRDSNYLGLSQIRLKRDNYKLTGHSKSFGQSHKNLNEQLESQQQRINIKPKIIAVLRSGVRPRKSVRVLLNSKNTKSFENLLADLTSIVKLDTGAVRKIFTLSGKPVVHIQDFVGEEVFVAYGVDKCDKDDFDLDIVEFKGVQSILKSTELDSKYPKFSSIASSPKNSRKKFLNSRIPVKSSGISTSVSPKSEIELKYEIKERIGDGNFAVVKIAKHRKSRKLYALKIIDKRKCEGKEKMIESEIDVLRSVTHPHIIQLLEVFETADEKHLVTEYISGGDLFDAIARDTKYSESVSKVMIRDLTSALKYLHDRNIVHRDIKPENLLVFNKDDGSLSLKLGDFGLAVQTDEPLFTVCGTPTYVAPEILVESGYSLKVDVWATGVIMYILLCGFPPFSSPSNDQDELFDQILTGCYDFVSPDWDHISFLAKELISWMLQVDPIQRYSAFEVLEHKWTHD